MKAGLPISLLLHSGVIFGSLIFARSPAPLAEGRVIPIELITVAPESNIRASVKRTTEEVVPSEEPMVLTSPMERAENTGDEVKKSPPENPQSEEPKETVQDNKNEPSSVENSIDAAEEEKPSFDLDKLAALIDKTKETAPEKNRQKTLQGESDSYVYDDVSRQGTGAGTAMTLTELDALQSAMYKCWRMPADAQDPEKLIVRLRVRMQRGGFVEDVTVIDRAASRKASPGNPFWNVAEQRAIRAVSQCAPYDFLPSEKFSQWQTLTLNFRPQL